MLSEFKATKREDADEVATKEMNQIKYNISLELQGTAPFYSSQNLSFKFLYNATIQSQHVVLI